MRNFDERKQEILRRAEVRIQHRKKVKKQLLGIGVPAVCLALVLGVFLSRGEEKIALGYSAAEDRLYEEVSQYDAPAADAPMADAPAADAPAADAPAADAPLYDHTHADAPAADPGETLPDLLPGVPGETFTEYESVYVRVDEETLALGTPVILCWNQSGETVHLDSFLFERWEDGRWVSCAKDGEARSEPMEVACSGDVLAAAFSMGWREHDYTQPGLYRCICTFQVGEDEIQYTMWAEFALA